MAGQQNPSIRTSLMSVLWDIQKKRRFISRDDMTKIASEFHMSRMDLEGVISFYHFYHRTHAGKFTIYLNNAVIAKNKDYHRIRSTFEEVLGIKVGQVTEDQLFGLFETSCIGLSDQEVSVLINFQPFTELNPKKVKKIVNDLKNGISLDTISNKPKTNIRYTPKPDKTVFFKDFTPGIGLAKLKDLTPVELIEIVKKSKLAGRGGAFFPTGLKWDLCRKQNASKKYIICNADEGEPGTFKDRVLLTKYPGLVLEGMLMAAYAVGADEGIIYLRAEYFYLKDLLEKTIAEFKDLGLLGTNILGIDSFNFKVRIHMGAGAYVCGEETALIASMEGKRGEPTIKEYFPVEKGFLGQPTIVNNVETLCVVPRLLEMGLDSYLKIGTEATRGTKLLSVSGDCSKPGLYEIEWGIKLKDFLNKIGAKDPYIILFNGFAGDCLSEKDFDREISGENLLAEHIQFEYEEPIAYTRKMRAVGLRSGGSFMVFSKKRNLLELLQNINSFFVSESCGICVPCRTGNFLLQKKLQKISRGHGGAKDLKEMKEWSHIIKQSSRCGLGKTSTTCLLTSMLKFQDEFDSYLHADGDFNEAFDLQRAVASYDDIINEIETSYG